MSKVTPFEIIMSFGSLPDTTKMVILIKIFSTSVVEVEIIQDSLTIHAKAVTIPGSSAFEAPDSAPVTNQDISISSI